MISVYVLFGQYQKLRLSPYSHRYFIFLGMISVTAHSQSIENVWPNKCQYTIEIPTTAHIIGSQIPYHIRIIPFVKGISLYRLHVELKENYVFSVLDSKNAVVAERKMERTISSATSDGRSMGDDEWNIRGHIEVPNSLDRCTQDCDAVLIKVKHR